jgi:hypothetical protein
MHGKLILFTVLVAGVVPLSRQRRPPAQTLSAFTGRFVKRFTVWIRFKGGSSKGETGLCFQRGLRELRLFREGGYHGSGRGSGGDRESIARELTVCKGCRRVR